MICEELEDSSCDPVVVDLHMRRRKLSLPSQTDGLLDHLRVHPSVTLSGRMSLTALHLINNYVPCNLAFPKFVLSKSTF